MKQSLEISRFGGPAVLKMIQQSPSPLGRTDVRVQVTASGVNFADIMMRMGLYPEAPKPPFVPGYEIAGRVVEVGSDVKSFRPGDRVLAGTRFGGYTSEIILSEYQLRIIPDRLSDVEAAAIPVNFLTAWVALHEMGRVRKGDRVLVQSAAGGVGVAATQIAAQVGAKVVGLVGSDSKKETVKSLGASEVLTYEEWEKASDSDQGGFQVVLDSTGGASLKRSFRRLSASGRVITFGVSSLVSGQKRSLSSLFSLVVNTTLFTPYKLMMENKGIFGLNMLQLFEEPQKGKFNPMLESMTPMMERFRDGSFKVIVGKTFSLEQGGAAHDYLQSRANTGKVVLISPSGNS
jgi:2-desacetyl-2-hydroxyethyl bacteriochlorophyllide A dehydrogenase